MISRVGKLIGGSWRTPFSGHLLVVRARNIVLIVRFLAIVSWLLLYGCGVETELNASFVPVGTVRNTDVVASEPFSFGWDSTGRSRLVLSGVNGSVVVTGAAAGSNVTVNGEREVGSDSLADAAAQLQQLKVEVEETGTDIVVRTVQPANLGGRRYTVNYQIQLPASIALSIVNVNGSVGVNGMTGDVYTSLVNGRIEAALEPSAMASIRLTVENGYIDLRLPQSTSTVLSAEVAHGNITLTDLVLQNVVRTSTLLQGMLGAGSGTVFLKTTNGSIWLDDLT